MIVFTKLWETMEKKGFSTYRLREYHGFDGKLIQRLKKNENITTHTLDRLCEVLECDLSDIAEFVPNESKSCQ